MCKEARFLSQILSSVLLVKQVNQIIGTKGSQYQYLKIDQICILILLNGVNSQCRLKVTINQTSAKLVIT